MSESITYHLTPAEVWMVQAGEERYIPEGFETEGFIHCTDGAGRVIEVGNRYYTADARTYCVLSIDRARISERVVYEDVEATFPHIYGTLNTDAVLAVHGVERDSAGQFLGFGEAIL